MAFILNWISKELMCIYLEQQRSGLVNYRMGIILGLIIIQCCGGLQIAVETENDL